MTTLLMSAKGGGSKSTQCKVCGDESSGFHYGVDSCEGCKGFFRRCITQGMTHKCANEEKCEITPFTRNSCQYCRLTKCFQVGMSREASRLGRRPKRLKDSSGESSRSHTTNLPIAPYPSPNELYKLRMAELKKLLENKAPLSSDLMQTFLAAAQQSFREHSRSGGGSANNSGGQQVTTSTTIPVTASPVTSPPISIVADENLNPDPSTLTNSLDLPPGGSPSSLQTPSPFLDLSTADISPLTPGGTNINMDIFENKMILGGSGVVNLNGNSLYSPGAQNMNDNMLSPLEMPPLDNLDPCSPSTFMNLNTNQMALQDALSLDNSNNFNSMLPGTSDNSNNLNNMLPGTSDTAFSPGPSTDNMNVINSSLMAQPNTNLMSPHSIKLESEPSVMNINANFNASSDILIKEEPKEFEEDEAKVEQIMAEVKKQVKDERRVLINQVTGSIVNAHMMYGGTTRETAREAFLRLSQAPTPDMPDISTLSVGPSILWQKLLSSMVPEITKVVKFVKKLPGFTEVSLDNQIKLIKQGSFEVHCARHTFLVDPIKEIMLDPGLTMISPREMILKMPMGRFLDEVFTIAAEMHPIYLNDSELALFSAILVLSPDRDEISKEARDTVHVIQQLYLQALYFLMLSGDPEEGESRFRRLIGLIPLFQKVNNDHAKFLNSIKLESASHIEEFPKLHQEVYQEK